MFETQTEPAKYAHVLNERQAESSDKQQIKTMSNWQKEKEKQQNGLMQATNKRQQFWT